MPFRFSSFLFLLSVVLLSAGCTDNEPQPPENLIKEDRYIDLLAEFQMIRSYQETLPQDSVVVDSLTRVVYKKYGISREQFIESHNYYRQDFEQQIERLDEAIERIRMDQIQQDTTETETDSTDTSIY